MKIRYKRDLNSNYMILTDQEPPKDTYEVRMITENRIYGLLPCVRQKYEDRTEYYYEITGRQSMELLYERRNLNYEQLRGLLKELLRVLKSAEEYLLGPEHFLLRPESLYLHAKSEKLCLCYYPGYEKEIRESFLELAEYLLGKLDKSDAKGIAFGYELYQSALETNFSLVEILCSHAEKEREEIVCPPPEPVPLQVSVQKEVLEKTGSWKNFFHKKTRKPKPQPQAELIAEEDPIRSGAALFLREENPMLETACLQNEKPDGLFLHSLNPEYPDFLIREETFLLGKKKDSVDGCIPAPTISRIHARITCEGAVYYVEDLNSTNGTWADQVQLNPYELCPLRDGMGIAFAGAEYEVRL